jgi:hypothetical protein
MLVPLHGYKGNVGPTELMEYEFEHLPELEDCRMLLKARLEEQM